MLNLFSFHLIPSHRSFSWKLPTASISVHLMSSEFFHLISALRSPCHLISAHLMSLHFLRNQLALLWYFMVVHLMSKHLISHQFFLHLPFNLFPKPNNKTPQQLFPCRRHKKFRVGVSAVSDPCLHWDTHSKPSHREAPTQKGFYTQKALHREAFTHSKLLHRIREAFIHRKLFHRASFYTEKHLHREALTHSKLFHTKALHTASFYTEKLLHREALSQRSICTEKILHQAFEPRKSANKSLLQP